MELPEQYHAVHGVPLSKAPMLMLDQRGAQEDCPQGNMTEG